MNFTSGRRFPALLALGLLSAAVAGAGVHRTAAMRGVLRRGLRLPQEVAIVRFDGIEDGRFSTPTLTTIAQDKEAVARLAVDLLCNRIEGRSGRSRTRVSPWSLKERESTGGPRPEAQAEVDT